MVPIHELGIFITTVAFVDFLCAIAFCKRAYTVTLNFDLKYMA